jgi:drug/metabolite transporter (DMT)-like permease
VFLTLCHMLACSAMSYMVAASRMVTLQPVKSRAQFYKISLLALIFCFTVVLGNVSLKFIPVSFNQAIGATTPAFTAALAWVMVAQRESRRVYLSLVPVMIGIVIASNAEPMFNLVGFAAAVTATCARALKSVMQGLMLADGGADRMDSLSLLMYMAPVAVVALIPTTLFFEPDAAALAMQLGQNGSEWLLGWAADCWRARAGAAVCSRWEGAAADNPPPPRCPPPAPPACLPACLQRSGCFSSSIASWPTLSISPTSW